MTRPSGHTARGGSCLRILFLASWAVCATAAPGSADQLILIDGRTVTGDILQDDTDTGWLVIGLVEDGQRTGFQEVVLRKNIQDIRRTGAFKKAPFRPLSGQCYQYGVSWGRCTMAAYFGYRCADLERFVVPRQCSDSAEMKRGIRDGVESVYRDFPEIPQRDTENSSRGK